ncbi:MAG: hypothetical protein LUG25_03525 [Oscillospiraceae bacterium]|nr:hypothetical protein [Oscillospiraceae bacterium]
MENYVQREDRDLAVVIAGYVANLFQNLPPAWKFGGALALLGFGLGCTYIKA